MRHVLAVVLWIGGVGLVTTVVLPTLRHMPDPSQRLAMFEAVESRFGKQARISVIVAGLTGLYMLVRMNAWYRFVEPGYWWMLAIVLIWTIFILMLFFVEPFVLHRRFAGCASIASNAAFRTAGMKAAEARGRHLGCLPIAQRIVSENRGACQVD